jgi:acyl-CoA dehydrogenase
LSEMSNILLDQADRLFQQHCNKDLLAAADRGEWPAGLWQAVEDAGLPLVLVPEAVGGVGLDLADVARLVRHAAYHTLPLPLPETVIANAVWAEAGGEAVTGSLTLAPTNSVDRVTIRRAGDKFALEGSARRVPWGLRTDYVLVFAQDQDGQNYLCLLTRSGIQAGNERTRNVAYEPRETLRFDGVTPAADAVRPAPTSLDADGFLLLGALFRAQQMIGGMERCLDYALTYANERVQFGRPIGKFQAIQHMLAIAAGHFAAATAAADVSAESYRTPGFGLSVAIAKARCGEAAGQVAAACHQVHAAMGFTQEHPLHFATRRLWSWRDEFGSEAIWQERIGRMVCAKGGEALWAMLVNQ